MPCRVVVEGELATVHVTLADPRGEAGAPESAGAVANEFPEILHPMPGREGEVKELREQLEDELTDEARRLLASTEVNVTLTWEEGSLEVAALIAGGKLVADVGAFLTGVREIRDLFPRRIRERISAWLGRDVAMRRVNLEMKTGLLHGRAEEPSAGAKDSDTQPFSVDALRSYAVLSLAVLVLVAGLVIGGVALLI